MTELTTNSLITEINALTVKKMQYKAIIAELELELYEGDIMTRINTGKTMLKELEVSETELKNKWIEILQSANIDKFESNGTTVSIKVSPGKLIIEDESLITDDYKKTTTKTTTTVDKKAVKEDLAQGVIIEGVRLEKEVKLEIKNK